MYTSLCYQSLLPGTPLLACVLASLFLFQWSYHSSSRGIRTSAVSQSWLPVPAGQSLYRRGGDACVRFTFSPSCLSLLYLKIYVRAADRGPHCTLVYWRSTVVSLAPRLPASRSGTRMYCPH